MLTTLRFILNNQYSAPHLIPLFVSSTSSLTGKAASPCFAIVFAILPFTRKPCYLRQQVCKFSPNCDGRERKCIRVVANHYKTTLRRRSKDWKPLLAEITSPTRILVLSLVLLPRRAIIVEPYYTSVRSAMAKFGTIVAEGDSNWFSTCLRIK